MTSSALAFLSLGVKNMSLCTYICNIFISPESSHISIKFNFYCYYKNDPNGRISLHKEFYLLSRGHGKTLEHYDTL